MSQQVRLQTFSENAEQCFQLCGPNGLCGLSFAVVALNSLRQHENEKCVAVLIKLYRHSNLNFTQLSHVVKYCSTFDFFFFFCNHLKM